MLNEGGDEKRNICGYTIEIFECRLDALAMVMEMGGCCLEAGKILPQKRRFSLHFSYC